jgi:hypothetical protein
MSITIQTRVDALNNKDKSIAFNMIASVIEKLNPKVYRVDPGQSLLVCHRDITIARLGEQKSCEECGYHRLPWVLEVNISMLVNIVNAGAYEQKIVQLILQAYREVEAFTRKQVTVYETKQESEEDEDYLSLYEGIIGDKLSILRWKSEQGEKEANIRRKNKRRRLNHRDYYY